jgi:hypothetical protein
MDFDKFSSYQPLLDANFPAHRHFVLEDVAGTQCINMNYNKILTPFVHLFIIVLG